MSKRSKSSNIHASQDRTRKSIFSALPLGPMAGAAIIVMAVFLAYLPSIGGGFIFDDDKLLTENALIKAPDGLYRFWCTTEATDYWPATNTTLWIEWRLWEMNSTGYHVTNLILHVVESLLIWIILRKLSIPGAFLAAMIFAVHPVNVESVAWIAQRKNTLAMFFLLLSILFYLKWEISSSLTNNDFYRNPSSLILHPSSFLWYWLSLAAFALAMLSKGSAVVLPVLLLGIVWWLRPLTRRDLVQTVPFFVVAVVLTGANIWFQTHGKDIEIRSADFAQRLLGAGGVVWFYLYKALLPVDLAFIYPQWHINAGNPQWWLPLAAVLVVTALLWRYRMSWGRPFLFAWGFFCVALIPVLGFMDVGFMKYSLVADHYQHIAIISLIALAGAGWSGWHQRTRGEAQWAAMGIAIVAAGILAFLTWRQSGLYRDPITLYQDTLEKNPVCWMAHSNLANALADAGRVQEAIEHYRQALTIEPNSAKLLNNLGIALLQASRPQEAIAYFQQALQVNPNFPEIHNNLGAALAKADRPQEAIEHYKQALQLTPNSASVHYNLALAYSRMQQSSETVAAAQKAIGLARSRGQTTLARQIEDWLNSYRAGLSDGPDTPPASH